MRAIAKKDVVKTVPVLGDKFEHKNLEYIVVVVNTYWIFAVPFNDAIFEPKHPSYPHIECCKGTITAERFKITDFEWIK